ncbi:phospholipase D family protein [Bdellovibrio sp. SKB1291214]|uniref:phospholipase D family protein n=1 Tax=Bdellovibrio sp. SKB1291214 TaxID=1732569 RepID=UPI0020CC3F54|nr:phospholipase D family protein [Bdellovibrio sp. SKB1291214]UYL10704.1 phospholipase D family protein [Bdellovibrio sp. SKB1291214]
MGMVCRLFIIFFAVSTLNSCATLPKNVHRTPSSTLAPDPSTKLSQVVREKLKGHAEKSAFHPLISGEDAFIARIASVRAAARSIDMQYYIWNNDLTGSILTEEVLKAADRGVRVRILLDDLNLGQYEKGLRTMAMHPNVQIRMVNPFANRSFRIFEITRLSEVDRRMHNKVLIADSEVAIIGGRNIGDEYFWASNDINFGDMDLWTIGPVLSGLSQEFDTYWNSDISYPIETLTAQLKPTEQDYQNFRSLLKIGNQKATETSYAKGLKNDQLIKDFSHGNVKLYWGVGHVVYDPPAKFKEQEKEQVDNLHSQIRPYMNNAREDIMMISPYFVPGDRGVSFLKDKIDKGIKVTVLTNSLASSDVSSVFAGYKGYRKDLLEIGVALYELRPKSHKGFFKPKRNLGSSGSHAGLHGKTLVFDKRFMYVGSMNLDPRSAYLNSEMGVIVDCPELAENFWNGFAKNLPEVAFQLSLNEQGDLVWTTYDDGKKNTFAIDPDTSWWQRAKASVMSVFIPEKEL